MFLLLEDNDVILMDNIVALTRCDGTTTITNRDNSVTESVFTPATLDRRSSRFITNRGAAGPARLTGTKWTEDS